MNGYKYRTKIFIEEEVFRDIDLLLKDELRASSLTNLNDAFEATYDDNITDALKIHEQFLRLIQMKLKGNGMNLSHLKRKLASIL